MRPLSKATGLGGGLGKERKQISFLCKRVLVVLETCSVLESLDLALIDGLRLGPGKLGV